MKNRLVQWTGFVLTQDKQITDSQAIEYRFKNTGSMPCYINNFRLGSGQEFNENLKLGEISYGNYDIKFRPDLPGQYPQLSYMIKSYVSK